MLTALTRLVGSAGRTLWSGSPSGRMAVVGVLVVLVVVSGSLGMAALSSLMSLALVLAFLFVIYALVIRGR